MGLDPCAPAGGGAAGPEGGGGVDCDTDDDSCGALVVLPAFSVLLDGAAGGATATFGPLAAAGAAFESHRSSLLFAAGGAAAGCGFGLGDSFGDSAESFCFVDSFATDTSLETSFGPLSASVPLDSPLSTLLCSGGISTLSRAESGLSDPESRFTALSFSPAFF